MSESCGCDFTKNTLVVDKVRAKGVSKDLLPDVLNIDCECGQTFEMRYHEDNCPNCHMVYGVTPCSNDSAANVQAAGIKY